VTSSRREGVTMPLRTGGGLIATKKKKKKRTGTDTTPPPGQVQVLTDSDRKGGSNHKQWVNDKDKGGPIEEEKPQFYYCHYKSVSGVQERGSGAAQGAPTSANVFTCGRGHSVRHVLTEKNIFLLEVSLGKVRPHRS